MRGHCAGSGMAAPFAQFAVQPGLGKIPVTRDGARRNLQDLCYFIGIQPGKEPQLDDAALARVNRGQRMQRLIQRQQIGAVVPGNAVSCTERDVQALAFLVMPFARLVSHLVNRAATVSAASFTARIADKAIVAAFGKDLATRNASAASLPLPTNLGGTTVRVRDSNGVERLAPLFAVSAEQINYQIPAGTAAGTASITITNADGISATGEFNVTVTAPAIFTASANGQGAAIAIDALTGSAGLFNATQANGQSNILSVFGTGLGPDATDQDGNVSANVTATIGGRAATVTYTGRVPGLVGLNQFNVTIPAGLAAGTHALVITRGGVASNAVTITLK
jgi:uncharacterized protein (TIGR03437 family)